MSKRIESDRAARAEPKPTVECPSCRSVNKPNSAHCGVCGQLLREREREDSDPRPVVLERAMSGEIFTAVLGEAPKTEVGSHARGAPGIRQEPEVHVPDAQADGAEALIEKLRGKGEDAASRLAIYADARPVARATITATAEREATEAAFEALRAWQPAEGLRLLEDAVARGATGARVWLLVGEACLGLGRFYEAGGAFYRVLRLEPANGLGWLGLGKVLRKVDEFAAALQAVEHVLQIDGNIAEAWTERGVALERLGRIPEALRSFQKSLELRPAQSFVRAKRLELETRLLDVRGGGQPISRPHGRPEPDLEQGRAARVRSPPGPGGQILLALQGRTQTHADAMRELDRFLLAEAGPGPGDSESPKVSPHPARLTTYVEAFDEILHGGIPWGHVVLVQGLPGTMKSSLCLFILHSQAVRGRRRCMYLSLEERTKSLMGQMASLGLRMDSDPGSFLLVDRSILSNLLAARPNDGLANLREAIEAVQLKGGLDLLAIDCLQAIAGLGNPADRRGEMHRMFDWLRDLDATTFLISEGSDWTTAGRIPHHPEEYYLADGIIQLRMSPSSEYDLERQLRVLKMRGTKHETGYHALSFDRGRFRVRRSNLA